MVYEKMKTYKKNKYLLIENKFKLTCFAYNHDNMIVL